MREACLSSNACASVECLVNIKRRRVQWGNEPDPLFRAPVGYAANGSCAIVKYFVCRQVCKDEDAACRLGEGSPW